jgi:ribonuclease P protein component
MKGLFTFSKHERLTGKTSIDQLFNEGKSFNLFPFRVFYNIADHPAEPAVRLLIAIPKKKVKHAVDRNRLRRLVREAYRLNKPGFVSFLETKSIHLHVALIYTGESVDLPYGEVFLKITACLARLVKIIGSESGKEIQ